MFGISTVAAGEHKFISASSNGELWAVGGPSGHLPLARCGEWEGHRGPRLTTSFFHKWEPEWHAASAHVSEVPEQLQ